MPKLTLPLGQTQVTITRPIVNSIIKDIIEITKIPTPVRVMYPDTIDKMYQAGSTINPEDDKLQLGSENKIFIEVEEIFDEETMLSSAISYPEHDLIFKDSKLLVYAKPIKAMSTITINVKYHAQNETQAKRWLAGMRARVAQSGMSMIHAVEYSYEVPEVLTYILKEIHRLRENNLPYGEDYETYVTKCFTKRRTKLSNLSGEQIVDAIPETNLRVMGYFDLTGTPDKGDRDSDQDGWTVEFSYKVNYEKPYAIFFDYPLVIHNQELSSKYFDTSPTFDFDAHARRYSSSSEALYGFERCTYLQEESGYRLPPYDDYAPVIKPTHVINLYTALCTIDPSRPKYLMTLNQSGMIKLHPKIVDFMVKESSYMHRQFHSIFFAQLFEDYCRFDDSLVRVNPSLELSCTGTVDQRRNYRVRFGIIDDISLLTDDARERLRENGDAFNIIIQVIIPGLKPVPLRPDGSVPKPTFDKVVDIIQEQIKGGGNWQKYRMTTVEFLRITAYHKEL